MLTLFSLTSCVTNKHIFNDQNFNDFGQTKIQTVVKLEKKRHSKDITPNNLVEIGKGIYPNENNFILATPKTYKIKERPNFKIEIEYFYSETDSTVKVMLYQWDYLKKSKSHFTEEENYTKKFSVFQKKFDDLKTELTKGFGEPTVINIEQDKINGETFRDDLKWKNKDGLNVYLFMFGNNSSGYRQIRLAIYKD
ncbi:hypothetical protein C8P67_1272 [Flavobacterium aquicola]|uniref:Uncharacterized protein n=2 Tax=Flavobacterium aquicola TaxID=1682742 RepID=A0A3E0DVX0_9FLAO|nr:hypothetical protein C8P67_1272 [Flavobacterium aquicola]